MKNDFPSKFEFCKRLSSKYLLPRRGVKSKVNPTWGGFSWWAKSFWYFMKANWGPVCLSKFCRKKTRSLRVKSAAVPVTTAAGSGGKKAKQHQWEELQQQQQLARQLPCAKKGEKEASVSLSSHFYSQRCFKYQESLPGVWMESFLVTCHLHTIFQ